MSSPELPSDRLSRVGAIQFVIAAAGLLLGIYFLRIAGLAYLSPPSSWTQPSLFLGLALLVACGACIFAIVRRQEYPWILALAAIALPLFEPSRAPYGAVDRVIFAIRDLVLVGAAVLFLVKAIGRADELERRTHLEALSWSYTTVVVALVCLALVEDLLPPIRGTWIASGMLATWFVAWIGASIRYQR